MTSKLKNRMSEDAALTEAALEKYFVNDDPDIAKIFDSEKYSLFAGGKRIRPFLVLEFCRMLGGTDEAALPFACAVEMIHTYSLIHDDLPCMDNDDMRRGKPTNHVAFGYSTALLAGDALLTKAFEVAASNTAVAPKTVCEAVRLLAVAAGDTGMIGGQVMDLAAENSSISEETLLKLYSGKTGALMRVSAQLGCIAAGCLPESPEVYAAVEFASKTGLAFQIIDDILDRNGDAAVLGKPTGSDEQNHKTTFLSFHSAEEAAEYAEKLTSEAVSEIAEFDNSEILTDFAVYLLGRNN